MEVEAEVWSAEDDRAFFHRLIGYKVIDAQGHLVGSVDAVFGIPGDQPEEARAGFRDSPVEHSGPSGPLSEFLGVRVGIFGLSHMHLVPAEFAEVDETSQRIALPFEAALVKRAPSLNADFEFGPGAGEKVYGYYRRGGFDYLTYGMRQPV